MARRREARVEYETGVIDAADAAGERLIVKLSAFSARVEAGRAAFDTQAIENGILPVEIEIKRSRKRMTRMSVEENKVAFRRYVEEVWIEEDLDFVNEIFAGKYLSHQPDGSALERGPEDVKKFVREYRSAFSDIDDVIEDMIGEGDRVATRWRLEATHTG
jgi:hypothetical protein